MKYPQQLIDKIWDFSDANMSVSKIAKMQNLKNEQDLRLPPRGYFPNCSG